MRTWTWSLGVAALALLAGVGSARADVTVRVTGPATPVAVGQIFDVTIAADLSEPVLGWGLDLGYDAGLLQPTGAPGIASPWIAFGGGDGDGLQGVFLPGSGSGLLGDDVLLATLSFQAVAQGVAALVLGVTASDLNEGFALDPSGFDANLSFVDAQVTIVPEPGSALLLALGLAVFSRRRFGAA